MVRPNFHSCICFALTLLTSQSARLETAKACTPLYLKSD